MKKEVFIFSVILLTVFLFRVEAKMEETQNFFETQMTSEPEMTSESGMTFDIKKEIPPPKFLFPKAGEKISGKVNLKFEVPEALAVEVYLRPPSSLTEIYLGKAQKTEGDIFELKIDSSNLPNRQYYLFLRVSVQLGDYFSNEILIEVDNEIETHQEEIQKVKQQLEPQKEVLEKTEGKISQITEKTAQNIEKTLREASEGVEELKPSVEKEAGEIKEKVKGEIKELKEIIEEETKKEIEEASKKELEKVKKEKEEKKEKIAKIATEVLEKATQEFPEKKFQIALLKKQVEEQTKEILKEIETVLKEKIKEKARISPLTLKDSDSDGLSDWEEIRLKTDPFNPDTDRDGFLDGIEYKRGFDPLKAGPADRVVWQDPRKAGKITDKLKVERVEIIFAEGKRKILISGKGIPNSFITLYIFSEPLVAMVKVKEDGNWEYILDKELADGNHAVYAALTNNKGEVEEKSSPFVFAKFGNKVLRIVETQAQLPQEPLKALQKSFLVLTVGLIVLALGISFFVIAILTARQRLKT
jgi:hypothetical protein